MSQRSRRNTAADPVPAAAHPLQIQAPGHGGSTHLRWPCNSEVAEARWGRTCPGNLPCHCPHGAQRGCKHSILTPLVPCGHRPQEQQAGGQKAQQEARCTQRTGGATGGSWISGAVPICQPKAASSADRVQPLPTSAPAGSLSQNAHRTITIVMGTAGTKCKPGLA